MREKERANEGANRGKQRPSGGRAKERDERVYVYLYIDLYVCVRTHVCVCVCVCREAYPPVELSAHPDPTPRSSVEHDSPSGCPLFIPHQSIWSYSGSKHIV